MPGFGHAPFAQPLRGHGENAKKMEVTYFVHSTSKDNEAGIRSGWSDVSLSEQGIEQAQSLCRQCAGMFFDAIFCSDLKRAAETTEIVFPAARSCLIPDSEK